MTFGRARITVLRVEAEGEHEHVRLGGATAQRLAQQRLITLPRRVRRRKDGVRAVERRVRIVVEGVQGDHITRREEGCGAVTGMVVHVDQEWLLARLPEPRERKRRVVQEAEAAVKVRKGVMAWVRGEGVGCRSTRQDHLDRMRAHGGVVGEHLGGVVVDGREHAV